MTVHPDEKRENLKFEFAISKFNTKRSYRTTEWIAVRSYNANQTKLKKQAKTLPISNHINTPSLRLSYYLKQQDASRKSTPEYNSNYQDYRSLGSLGGGGLLLVEDAALLDIGVVLPVGKHHHSEAVSRIQSQAANSPSQGSVQIPTQSAEFTVRGGEFTVTGKNHDSDAVSRVHSHRRRIHRHSGKRPNSDAVSRIHSQRR
eukprot:1182491-Prorocentrum_minimum.AAC.1